MEISINFEEKFKFRGIWSIEHQSPNCISSNGSTETDRQGPRGSEDTALLQAHVQTDSKIVPKCLGLAWLGLTWLVKYPPMQSTFTKLTANRPKNRPKINLNPYI